MRDALAVRDFRLLLTGNLVSSLGSWLVVVAIPYHVYRITGSVAATGLTLAAESVPALVVGPVAGVLVDRWDRRRLMVATNALRALALAPLLAADRPDRLWLVYAAIVAENLGSVFFRPAARAFTPAVVGTGPALAGANAATAAANGVIRLVGPPLGAALLTWVGFAPLVWADAASYAVAGLAVALVETRPVPEPRQGRSRELREGLTFTLGGPTLRGLLALNTVFLTANAVFTALLVPFVGQRFGRDPGAVGWLLSALGAGYLLGAPLAGWLVRRWPPRPLLAAAQAAVAACFATLVLARSLPVALVALGLAGPPGALMLVTVETTVQVVTPDPLLGRVGATFLVSEAAAELAGALLGAALGAPDRLSVVLLAGAGVIAVAAVAGLALPSAA